MRCHKPVLSLAVALLAVACDRTRPREKAADAARDVAMVEAAQTLEPPVQRLDPQPMGPNVRLVVGLSGAGCDFLPDARRSAGPVLVAGPLEAVMRVHGEPMILAADSGSAEIMPALREKYVGRTHWAQLTTDPASLTIRDRYERIVYSARGTLSCRDRQ